MQEMSGRGIGVAAAIAAALFAFSVAISLAIGVEDTEGGLVDYLVVKTSPPTAPDSLAFHALHGAG